MMNGFQLAAAWSPKLRRDLAGWLWSEKLDGVRALWDPRRGLVSRKGHIFKAPSDFTCSLPKNIVLDGELYIDRGMFHDTVSVLRTRSVWTPLVKFKVFDVWCPSMQPAGYSNRLEWFRHHSSYTLLDDHVHLVEQHTLDVGDAAEVLMNRDLIVGQGGEGLILRDPKGLFHGGRQAPSKSSMLKVKPYLDEEAEVLSVSLSRGRKGSVTVRDQQGRVFKIGSGFRDIDTEPPPRVGTVITFGYTSRHDDSGIPRFPRYIRIRSDSCV